jgi:hypothetical protein
MGIRQLSNCFRKLLLLFFSLLVVVELEQLFRQLLQNK